MFLVCVICIVGGLTFLLALFLGPIAEQMTMQAKEPDCLCHVEDQSDEIDLNSVAALLTLIGYSVTDKVVVYDRIRENLAKFRTMPLRQLIDLSINQPSAVRLPHR